jgi:hypothetical protein
LFALLKFTTTAAPAALAEGESGFATGWSFCPRVLLRAVKKLLGAGQIAVLKRSSDCGEIESSIRSKEGIILAETPSAAADSCFAGGLLVQCAVGKDRGYIHRSAPRIAQKPFPKSKSLARVLRSCNPLQPTDVVRAGCNLLEVSSRRWII